MGLKQQVDRMKQKCSVVSIVLNMGNKGKYPEIRSQNGGRRDDVPGFHVFLLKGGEA